MMLSASSQAVALALGSAAVWGTSDFTGGFVTRRASPVVIVTIAHGFGMCLLLILAAALRLPFPTGHTVLYGVLSGVTGGVGLMLFYRALSLGSMGLTSALSGVLTAAIPVIVSFFREGHPTTLQLIGFGVAAIAIWLVAYTQGGTVHPHGLGLGIVAGLCFGLLFVLLQKASQEGVIWGLTLARISSTSAAVGIAFCLWLASRGNAAKKPPIEWKSILPLAALAGFLDTLGNVLYVLSSLKGRLDVAAVLSSLYPAGPILLGVWILKERTTRMQTVGMVLALVAVALISL